MQGMVRRHQSQGTARHRRLGAVIEPDHDPTCGSSWSFASGVIAGGEGGDVVTPRIDDHSSGALLEPAAPATATAHDPDVRA